MNKKISRYLNDIGNFFAFLEISLTVAMMVKFENKRKDKK